MLICSPAGTGRGRRLRPNPGRFQVLAGRPWRGSPGGDHLATKRRISAIARLAKRYAVLERVLTVRTRRMADGIPRNAHQLGGRQKEDARHGPSRISEPMLYGNGAARQGEIEHAAVPIDVSPYAPVLR